MPEPGVHEVQHRVFDAAHVQVHATAVARELGAGPVPFVFQGTELVGILRINVAQLVPGGAGPLRHDIGVPPIVLQAIAQVQFHIHPVGGLGQRGMGDGIGVVRVEGHRLVVFHLGQDHGQGRFGQGVRHIVLIVHNGERLTPVALAGKQPIAQLILDFFRTNIVRNQPGDSVRNGGGGVLAVDVKAVGVGGVNVRRVTNKRLGGHVPVEHRHDGQAKHGSKLVVAGVVRGHGHDRPRAVAGEHIVGDKDRHLLAIDRVGGVGSQEHAGFVLILLPFDVRLCGNGRPVGGHRRRGSRLATGPAGIGASRVGGVGREGVDKLMLGGQHQVGCAKQGVGAGGKHRDRMVAGGEIHLGAAGPADPIPLHVLDLIGPIQNLKIINKPVGICSNAHHPLRQLFAEHREVTALGTAVGGHFLVRQHCAQAGAPIHHGIRPVDQPVFVNHLGLLHLIQLCKVRGAELLCELFRDGPGAILQEGDEFGDAARLVGLGVEPGVEDLEENPLGPAVIVLVGGGDGAALIVPQPQTAQLTLHVFDRFLRFDRRVRAGLDGVLLRRQAERIIAQGVQHILAEHAVEPGECVGGNVSERVAHV